MVKSLYINIIQVFLLLLIFNFAKFEDMMRQGHAIISENKKISEI